MDIKKTVKIIINTTVTLLALCYTQQTGRMTNTDYHAPGLAESNENLYCSWQRQDVEFSLGRRVERRS